MVDSDTIQASTAHVVVPFSIYAASEQLRPLAAIYAELGHALMAAGRPGDAAHSYREAIREDGSSAELHYYLAEARRAQDRPDDAFQSYLDAVRLDPHWAPAALTRAQALLTYERAQLTADYDLPLDSVELSTEAAAEIHHFLGRSSRYRGDYALAIEHERKALSLRPTDSAIMAGLGAALLHHGRLHQDQETLEEAVGVLREAVTLADRSGTTDERAYARCKLAAALLEAHHPEEALGVVHEALALKPATLSDYYLVEGRIKLSLGDYQGALDAAAAATAESTAYVQSEAAEIRVRTLLALERYDETLSETEQLLQFDSGNLVALIIRARAIVELGGDLAQAARLVNLYCQRRVEAEIRPTDLEATLERVSRAFEHTEDVIRRAALAELKVAIITGLDRPAAEVAAALFSAGLEHNGRADWSTAVRDVERLMRRAIKLDPKLQTAYWYLAESINAQGTLPDYPFVDAERTEEARRVLEAGMALGPLSASDSWAHRVVLLVNEQLYKAASLPRTELIYQSIVAMERAVLLNDEAMNWAYLARAYRGASCEDAVFQAAVRALELGSNYVPVLDELAAGLANAGIFEHALTAVELRIKLQDDAWIQGVKAFIYMGMGEPAKALEILPDSPQNVWDLEIRAFCRWLLGDREGALADYRSIMEIAGQHDDDHGSWRAYAWAALMVGELEKARERQELLLKQIVIDRDYVLRDLGFCYLLLGRLEEAEQTLVAGIEQARNDRVLNELRFELEDAITRFEDDPGEARRVAVARHAIEQIAAKSEALLVRRRDVPLLTRVGENLIALVQDAQTYGDEGGWGALAGVTGGARIILAGGAKEEAEQLYTRLLEARERFPEAALGLERSQALPSPSA